MFTPRKVAALEPQIREFTARCLDPLVGTGKFDFVNDLGEQMPMRVIGMLLGIPEEDQRRVADHGEATLQGQQALMASGEVFAVALMPGGHASVRTFPRTGLAVVDLMVGEGRDRAAIAGLLRDAFEADQVAVSGRSLKLAASASKPLSGTPRKAVVRQLKPRVRRAA